MPIDITKNLVERIIPELPLEPDIDVARAYVELLGNIVQLYGKRALKSFEAGTLLISVIRRCVFGSGYQTCIRTYDGEAYIGRGSRSCFVQQRAKFYSVHNVLSVCLRDIT